MKPGGKPGPYDILAPIGKGDTGEVCKAQDPRLRRNVAVKAGNNQFTERFTREARAIASVNQTNIAVRYRHLKKPDSGIRFGYRMLHGRRISP